MKGITSYKAFALYSVLFLWPAISPAAPDVYIPGPLQPWKAWVLKGSENHACPFLVTHEGDKPSRSFICAWPGRLDLNADAHGAAFEVHWRVDAAGKIPLPGSSEHWPQQVTVNGRAVPVTGASPEIWLEAGSYDIRGRFQWDQRPQQLAIPSEIGLLKLQVDGQPIPVPQRDDAGVTLGRGAGRREPESVELHVFRKLTDDVPASLETRIEVDASGADREAVFGPVLPPGFAPVSLSGDLAARLDADGRLRVQLQSGEWQLTVLARATGPLSQVSWNPPPAPWPAQEVWSYEATPRLRATSVHGPQAIDPAQANVPDEWTSLPAFVMSAHAVLTVEETSRGLTGTNRNQLHLAREAWRDFDGGAYYYKDEITGSMKQGWRLDVSAPATLQHAEEYRQPAYQPMLVTAGEHAGEQGIEMRNPTVSIKAGVRMPAQGSLPVSGWQETFESVRTTLHLPHGYLLLAAPGADSAVGSWISSWTLLDVFVVAVIGALAFRLFGRQGGVLALLFLVLAYQEPGVPVWSLGALCIIELLRKVLPAGRLRRAAGIISALVLAVFVLIALPFFANQLRYSVYPQLQSRSEWGLESPGASNAARGGAEMRVAAIQPAPLSPPEPAPTETAQLSEVPSSGEAEANAPQLGKIEVTGSRINTSDLMQRYAENTIVQAGVGEPAWSGGSQYELTWSGPVTAEQTVHLMVLPPWFTRLLRLLMLAALAGLVTVLARRLFSSGPGFVNPFGRKAGMAAMLAAVLIAGLGHPRPSYADAEFPPDNLLNTLRARLLEAPPCMPDCVTLANAQVRAAGDAIQLLLEVHAAETVAVPLPAAGDNMVLDGIALDGAPVDGAVSDQKGVLVMVPRGVHSVLVRMTVPTAGRVSLSFPLRPERVDFSGDGWQAGGIDRHTLQTDALSLTRLRAAAHTAVPAIQQFPPFVTLRRRISLNLDWTVVNQVNRVAPVQGSFTVDLPLLPHEHVLSKSFTVKDGAITVPVAEGSTETDWQSTLDRGAAFTLTAPPMSDHAEEWEIVVSPMWHAEFSGLPAVLPQRFDTDDFWVYEFHPLPGEKLTVSVSRPATMPGPTLAVDAVSLETQVGEHANEHTLALRIRSSQAGDHAISLPADSELLSVRKDGTPLDIPLREGRLVLPITAATQNFEIGWRSGEGGRMLDATPPVDLGSAAANVSVTLHPRQGRWILFTWGPRLGPAVLYWGELLVMILVAFGLSRMGGTPLKFRHWLLLGLGFSTFSWGALLAVVVWLLALDWRAKHRPEPRMAFKLLQLALVALTLIAAASLISSIPYGLLGSPDMHIRAIDGGVPENLQWFVDRIDGALPRGYVFTLPLWCYKLAMLAWALWLAFALVEWLRWAFSAWSNGGYWPEKENPAGSAPAASSNTPKENVP